MAFPDAHSASIWHHWPCLYWRVVADVALAHHFAISCSVQLDRVPNVRNGGLRAGECFEARFTLKGSFIFMYTLRKEATGQLSMYW